MSDSHVDSPKTFDYDLFVIGSGPAGQRASIQAAKLGLRVAVAERMSSVGGVCLHHGTIPSKTFREAALHLSGFRERSIYGASYKVKNDITMSDLLYRADWVIKNEVNVIWHQLAWNRVELFEADASFVGPHTIRLEGAGRNRVREVSAGKIVIACGTPATRDPSIPFDGVSVFTSDDILALDKLPKSIAIIGGGVIGCEYATIFAALGVRVTLIDKRPRLLEFVDFELIDELTHNMRCNRVVLHLGEAVQSVEKVAGPAGDQVEIRLESGKVIRTEKTLYSIGRSGAVDQLNLQTAGLNADDRGRLNVDENYQTEVPHIYAAGDVIGFPSLASTSMEQGRQAVCSAFDGKSTKVSEHFPIGIYTIPEISVCGASEEELTKQGVPYEVGKASYQEIARGQIMGDGAGLLKLMFHIETRELLGVAIIGEGAAELIHIGQSVMAHKGSVEFFVNTVFNYPTLAECYKTAAFDGVSRLAG
jgi:NAD(P) transhydrogenase